MAVGSSIEWTEATWNPVAGCSPVSPGCKNCYAARMALRLEAMANGTSAKYAGTAKRSKGGQPFFSGKINLDWDSLGLPRRWRKGRRIFVNSMSDLFHEQVPLEFIQAVFEVMEECPQHVFQVLTKRPERAAALRDEVPWPENVWMGTSVESMLYTHRVHDLKRIPAAIRFLSVEPLLGPIPRLPLSGVDWVIVGGESGPGARPMNEEWVVQIRDRCLHYGVAFFFKQWGGINKSATGRSLEGRIWDEDPLESARPRRASRAAQSRRRVLSDEETVVEV